MTENSNERILQQPSFKSNPLGEKTERYTFCIHTQWDGRDVSHQDREDDRQS